MIAELQDLHFELENLLEKVRLTEDKIIEALTAIDRMNGLIEQILKEKAEAKDDQRR